MGKEADKLTDLFSGKSLFRYWKKGIVFGILYVITWSIINAIFSAVAGMLNLPTESVMGALAVGGIGFAVTVLIGTVLQLIIGGFLIEYVNNAKNRFMKAVQR